MRFILDVMLVTERRCGPVKGDGDIVGFDVSQRFYEYGGKAESCVDYFPFACGQVFWYSVESAVYDCVSIYQYECLTFGLLF